MKVKAKTIINITSILIILISIYLGYKGYKLGIFTSVASLQKFLQQYGIWAPLIFMILQIIQIIIPVIPGGITTAFGVVMFGPLWGFVYNYISICLGSIIVFLISRFFGKEVVLAIFGEENFKKYDKWLNHEKYDKFFAWAILLPVAPDDFLCYFSGLTDMKLMTFVKIIIFCKPPSIFIYSMGLVLGIKTIFKSFAWKLNISMV